VYPINNESKEIILKEEKVGCNGLLLTDLTLGPSPKERDDQANNGACSGWGVHQNIYQRFNQIIIM